jgi:hypothetical protein
LSLISLLFGRCYPLFRGCFPAAGQPTARHLGVEVHPKYLPKDAEPSLALSCFCHGISARTAIIIGALPP